MNKDRLSLAGRLKLAVALDLNLNPSKIYNLKDYMKLIWKCANEDNANWLMDYWCKLAHKSELEPVIKFAGILQRHRQGIISHCAYPIDNGKLEGMDNALKVLKKKHYGFRDTQCFILKVKLIFNGCN
jgi:transposase